ncbi:MAG TPA: ribonuclease HI family protein [Candidatus Acidoferrum sp.]|jgi:ribonuclease HI
MIKRPQISRGARLFSDAVHETRSGPAAFQANIDGGSRGNPGPASYGVVVRNPGGEIVARLKRYIGRTTNNVAEYYGLIAALDYAESNRIRALRVESDSELLVRQMRGQYKVKSPELRPLFERAKKMSAALDFFHIEHVYRERNQEADALANEALDETAGGRPASSAAAKSESRPSPAEPRKLRANYRGGALHLREPLDFPEDTEVEILIRRAPKL